MAQQTANKMRKIYLEKATVNICVGNDSAAMEKANKLLVKLTQRNPVKCTAKKRLATWHIRPGLAIGYKVTMRGQKAIEFLKWMLDSKDNKIPVSCFDEFGNFSLGFSEYLELTKIKYDADVGIMGFEVMATFARLGYRIRRRILNNKKVPSRHKVTKEEVINYLRDNFSVEVEQ